MKLYSYFRSSASYRVRIALALKGLAYETVPVNLLAAEQKSSEYKHVNPQGLVPALEDGGQILGQSLAIMEYLDEAYPNTPALLPTDIKSRAIVRALAQLVACEIHPLNNLRVLQHLTGVMGLSENDKLAWYTHWIHAGFTMLEAELTQHAGKFCFGDTPTMADCCLVPQVFNAKRFDVELSAYPTINRIVEHCESLDAFIAASPAKQVDAA